MNRGIFLPALAPGTLTAPFSEGEEGSAQGSSTAAGDSCWKSPFQPDLRGQCLQKFFPSSFKHADFYHFKAFCIIAACTAEPRLMRTERPETAGRGAGPGCSPEVLGPPAPSWQSPSSLSCRNIPKEKPLRPRCLLGTCRRTRGTNSAALLVHEKSTGQTGLSQCFPPSGLARGAGTRLNLPFPLFIALFALGISSFPTLSFLSTALYGAMEAQTELWQAPVAHPQ